MDSPVSMAVELATLRTNCALALGSFFKWRLVLNNDLLFMPVIVVELQVPIKPVVTIY